MTDIRDNIQPPNISESIEALRDSLAQIGSCADESSDRQLQHTAAVLTDLLTVAAMFGDDPETNARAVDIVSFCRRKAMPTLVTFESDDALKGLCQDVKDQWSDSLSLLTPEERLSGRPDLGFEETGAGDRSHSTHGVAADHLPASSCETLVLPTNLEGILAALGEESDNTTSSLPQPPDSPETVDDPELAAAFADDAEQCVAEMEASLLGLESGSSVEESLRSFCRQLHTLKGASGTVGLKKLAKYLHDLETYVESADSDDIDVDRLLEGVDAVRTQLSTSSRSEAPSDADSHQSEGSGSSAQQTHGVKLPPSASSSTALLAGNDSELFVRVEASRLERLMDLLAELVMLRNQRDTCVDSLRTIHAELHHCTSRMRSLAPAVEPSAATAHFSEGFPGAVPGIAAAGTGMLSRSLDEVAEDTAELGRLLQEVFDPLSADNAAVSHLIGRFRQELMELRRLPVSGLFQRLQRAIRDAAKVEGKQVEIQFEGQGARAERAVQERLFEPLLHLVRNAVSHGLQSAEDRMRAGKPPVGTVTLTARSDAAFLNIEVRDDGRGLDDEVLESRGRALGLIPPGKKMTPKQLWKLIFHPGFSTKSSVSEISGRGIGMDVVDSWVRRLRGSIDVESAAGQGTTFRLHIPLRSAVEHAMIVRSGGQLFALPMHAVSGTSDAGLPSDGFSRESATRVVSLGLLLGCGSVPDGRGCHVMLRDAMPPSHANPLSGDQNVAIVVDSIVGVEEVVVRPLPPLLRRNELFAGVTLSGQAETVLLLDVRRVTELIQTTEQMANDHLTDRFCQEPSGKSDEDFILVVDDSVAVRRCLSKKLSAAGYRVREAGNGRDALDLLKSDGAAAVVTDIDMPVMNGIELLREIRRQQSLRETPVTVLTSRDDESMPAAMVALQPNAILCKPVTDESVAAIVDSLCGTTNSQGTD